MTTYRLHITLLLLLIVLSLAHPHPSASCPVPAAYSTLHHGHITISQGGTVSLVSGMDALCYNYTLPVPFKNRPGVAIAIKRMESSPTQQLFFSIRSSKSDSLGILSFLVRTQWRYTQWTMFGVTFFAEDHPHYDANSFGIDTTALAGCSQTKEVKVIIPFKDESFHGASAVAFIHGFEMSTTGCQAGSNPFEIQVLNLGVSNGGVALRVTLTSSTKVFNVYVSVISWCSSAQYVVGSTYQYKSFMPSSTLNTNTLSSVVDNTLDVYGVAGFIVSNGGSFSISSSFNANVFTFTTSTAFIYLGFSYFFISAPLCSDCAGYPIPYNGVCYSNCPAGTYMVNGRCISCPVGQIWNGNACVPNTPQCPNGMVWNGTACVYPTPQCPQGQVWNGSACVYPTPQCPQGQVWNGTACIYPTPQCPQGQVWNGSACVINIVCPPGMLWNGTACISSCGNQCPSGTYWNGSACVPQIVCPTGQIWNGTACVPAYNACPSGMHWNGTACVADCGCESNCPAGQRWNGTVCVPLCSGGQFWNGSACVCPANKYWNGSSCIQCGNGQVWYPASLQCRCPQGLYWNGYSCISCPTGQYWNQQTQACTCPLNQFWNGFACITCDGGRVWNQNLNSCDCPNGMHWTGNQCISCTIGQYWNGYQCISCFGGQVWNSISMLCECSNGYQWNGSKCIVPCPQGQISVGGICQCPQGTYLVNGNCQSSPSCPNGQVWNGTACVPISCPIGYYWNGQACTVQIENCPAGTYWGGFSCIAITDQCPTGTIWNGDLCYTNCSQCPPGSYWNGVSCSVISCQCPSTMHWVNGQCIPIGNNCPSGTYFNGQACIPTSPCTGGRIWNQDLTQCVCPPDSFWNGLKCVTCGGGQMYDGSAGCFCPIGLFFDGSKCSPLNSTYCSGMENSIWSQGKCQCNPGYIQEGKACICKGLAANGLCDRCYLKPNSQWKFGMCQCVKGYYQHRDGCKKYDPNPGPVPTNPQCNVATYFDDQQKRCLPCSDGCLSCTSCYACTQCRPEFTYNPVSQLCNQICGDSKRFTVACDDGNNINGDGCSADCKIESGYNCVGGSPNSKDTCSLFKPSVLTISQSGQSHLMNKIVLNVKLNYMPQELLKSATDCKNSCDSVLEVKIVNGYKYYTSIVSKYIPTTSYSFSIEIDFGREPIGLFDVEIGVQAGIALKYFSGINASQKLSFNVNPAFLSLYTGNKKNGDDVLK